eukprot:NODE_3298_length_993_cov_38.368360_g3152_i0.p1 GENE.NODE_3298_length_993_cov_38.368360_g3152_i0~~NODE_3298_length_993_cov_38.368360_g3152_i0.p1  ORF type:complete len:234 (+),score=53.38 NODE_3298_length_993_cov_38.368360_g3152_i0:115-816(+)
MYVVGRLGELASHKRHKRKPFVNTDTLLFPTLTDVESEEALQRAAVECRFSKHFIEAVDQWDLLGALALAPPVSGVRSKQKLSRSHRPPDILMISQDWALDVNQLVSDELAQGTEGMELLQLMDAGTSPTAANRSHKDMCLFIRARTQEYIQDSLASTLTASADSDFPVKSPGSTRKKWQPKTESHARPVSSEQFPSWKSNAPTPTPTKLPQDQHPTRKALVGDRPAAKQQES